MAIRKSTEETLVVEGARESWLERGREALEREGFSNIKITQSLKHLHATYRKLTIWGSLAITLLPEGDSRTQIQLVATGNVDNIYALFRSPSRQILQAFKAGLLDPSIDSAHV